MSTSVAASSAASSTARINAQAGNATAGQTEQSAPAVQKQGAEVVADSGGRGQPVVHMDSLAALDGRQNVLADLALKLAATLNMARAEGETLEGFLNRLADHIDKLPAEDRVRLVLSLALRGVRVPLPELTQAFRNPASALAARLVAQLETPAGQPGKTAAQAATANYLHSDSPTTRAFEAQTLRQTNVTTRPESAGPTGTPHSGATEAREGRELQNRLRAVFEGNRDEGKPATQAARGDTGTGGKEVANARPQTTPETQQAKADLPSAKPSVSQPAQAPSLSQQAASHSASASTSGQGNAQQAQAQAQAHLATPETAKASPSTSASGAMSQPDEDLPTDTAPGRAKEAGRMQARMEADHAPAKAPKMQTLLTLRGIAEVMTRVVRAPTDAKATAAQAAAAGENDATKTQGRFFRPASQPLAGEMAERLADPSKASIPVAAKSNDALAQKTAGQTVAMAADDAAVESRELADAQSRTRNAQAGQRQTETASRVVTAANDLPQGVPYAYATLAPARDEAAAELEIEEEDRHEDDEDQDGNFDEDAPKRRPRDAYDAIHDPIEDDPDVPGTNRDSSEAEIAFAFYRRNGF